MIGGWNVRGDDGPADEVWFRVAIRGGQPGHSPIYYAPMS